MPATLPDTMPTALRLKCVIKGEDIVFPVAVVRKDEVSDLKKKIQTERALGTLMRVDPHALELWKPKDANPIAAKRKDLLKRIELLGDDFLRFADELDPVDNVYDIFQMAQPPEGCVHIIVKVSPAEPSELGKRSRVGAGVIDLSASQEIQTKRYCTGLSPSNVSKDARSMQSQQDFAKILNGRPWTSSGPPVGLYHPVFDRFTAYFEESTVRYRTASSANHDDSMPSIDDAFSFMKASSHFYVVEQSGRVNESPPTGRVEAVLPIFSRLLGTTLPRVKNSDLMEPDARAIVRTPAGHIALPLLLELKLEPGIGGDAKTQAQQSYARTCSLAEHEPIRLSSCSPCFLVEIAGPWITVLGAVYLQKVLIQHLAGPIYLPPQGLHPINTINAPLRLFSALRRALGDLTRYYEDLPSQPTSSRFFPFVRSYMLDSGANMAIEYMAPLSLDDSKATYLAKQADGKEVVVKFTLTYNARAHRLLAGHGLAPDLIYDGNDGPRYGGLLMIVMDYVKGETLGEFLCSSPPQSHRDVIIKSVEKAITLLHAENLVFGDLRTPNILVQDHDNVKLVDFDWCGINQVDQYPFVIGDAIEWAEGVGPLATMRKEHDLHMLKKLRANIQAGNCPGYW